MRVLRHDPLAQAQFLGEIVDQQRTAMGDEILRLGVGLLLHLVRQMPGRPDLAVRMRVGAAHDLAAIFEDLHRADVGPAAERDRLLDPGVDHPLDVGDLHHREVRSWRGEKHSTRQTPRLRLRRRAGPLSVRASGASARARRSRCRTRRCARSRGCALRWRADFQRRGSNSDRAPGSPAAGIASRLPCQGRFIRWGETNTHSPVSGLKRRCEVSPNSIVMPGPRGRRSRPRRTASRRTPLPRARKRPGKRRRAPF